MIPVDSGSFFRGEGVVTSEKLRESPAAIATGSHSRKGHPKISAEVWLFACGGRLDQPATAFHGRL